MNVGWNGVHRLSGLGISMHMSKMVNVPAIMMMVYRRGAQCAPEQRKIERFLGEQCSPLRDNYVQVANIRQILSTAKRKKKTACSHRRFSPIYF